MVEGLFPNIPKTFLFYIMKCISCKKKEKRLHIERWPSSKDLSSHVTFPRDNMSECLVTLPSFDNVVFTIEN